MKAVAAPLHEEEQSRAATASSGASSGSIQRAGVRALHMPVPAHVVHADVVGHEQRERGDAQPVEEPQARCGAASSSRFIGVSQRWFRTNLSVESSADRRQRIGANRSDGRTWPGLVHGDRARDPTQRGCGADAYACSRASSAARYCTAARQFGAAAQHQRRVALVARLNRRAWRRAPPRHCGGSARSRGRDRRAAKPACAASTGLAATDSAPRRSCPAARRPSMSAPARPRVCAPRSGDQQLYWRGTAPAHAGLLAPRPAGAAVHARASRARRA